MEKQKTAVEFLYEFVLLKLSNEQQMQFEGLFAQAKQIEKEQIELAFFEGKNDGAFMERYSDYKHITANEYYNETYGKYENKAENNN